MSGRRGLSPARIAGLSPLGLTYRRWNPQNVRYPKNRGISAGLTSLRDLTLHSGPCVAATFAGDADRPRAVPFEIAAMYPLVSEDLLDACIQMACYFVTVIGAVFGWLVTGRMT
jgi:hypothetical protein